MGLAARPIRACALARLSGSCRCGLVSRADVKPRRSRWPRHSERDFRWRSAVRPARLHRPGMDCGRNVARVASDRCGASHAGSEEHTSELQSQSNLVCRLLLEKKKTKKTGRYARTSTVGKLVTVGVWGDA